MNFFYFLELFRPYSTSFIPSSIDNRPILFNFCQNIRDLNPARHKSEIFQCWIVFSTNDSPWTFCYFLELFRPYSTSFIPCSIDNRPILFYSCQNIKDLIPAQHKSEIFQCWIVFSTNNSPWTFCYFLELFRLYSTSFIPCSIDK